MEFYDMIKCEFYLDFCAICISEENDFSKARGFRSFDVNIYHNSFYYRWILGVKLSIIIILGGMLY